MQLRHDFIKLNILVSMTAHINGIIMFLSQSAVDWHQSIKQLFINVSYNILVISLTLMVLKTEPSELDWLQVYDMTH